MRHCKMFNYSIWLEAEWLSSLGVIRKREEEKGGERCNWTGAHQTICISWRTGRKGLFALQRNPMTINRDIIYMLCIQYVKTKCVVFKYLTHIKKSYRATGSWNQPTESMNQSLSSAMNCTIYAVFWLQV